MAMAGSVDHVAPYRQAGNLALNEQTEDADPVVMLSVVVMQRGEAFLVS